MSSEPLYIIVQGGGQGTRLQHLTKNKPKCLVSVRGKPILYHLFDTFPKAKFIVIGDHLYDVLAQYLLTCPPDVEASLIKATGTGTAAGIADAIGLVPIGSPFLICWSDLLIMHLDIPTDATLPVVYTTDKFSCRWSVNQLDALEETASSERGVMGAFFIPDKASFLTPPTSGEFVRWWSEHIPNFNVATCSNVEDFGELTNVMEANRTTSVTRFFNEVKIDGALVTKKVLDPNFADVHRKEVNWYRESSKLGFELTPTIYEYEPLTMQRVSGSHPFEFAMNSDEKSLRVTLGSILDALDKLHCLGESVADPDDIAGVYGKKTIERVLSVQRLIPHLKSPTICVNGVQCTNPFAHQNEGLIPSIVSRLTPATFHPIHGDPTFSNTLVDHRGRVSFIDPRGYFWKEGILGDKWYDIAKVYYSAAAGYDAFNQKNFRLTVSANGFNVSMPNNPFATFARQMFSDRFPNEMSRIETLTGLIWLSLTGYARDDVDSIIGSFAFGLLWLERGVRCGE